MNENSEQRSFIDYCREFMDWEAAGGIVLIGATLLALVAANSPWSEWYDALLTTHAEVRIGTFAIDKPLLLWINDGLMAVFFFLVGLEIKREILEGELSSPSQVVLPAVGAVGGMAVPALIYTWMNHGDPVAMSGWAIPVATDIAFALGILSLLGDRVPRGLKVFLLTLAIFDDLGAILVIALFYTSNLSLAALGVAALAGLGLFLMNRRGIASIAAYFFVGMILWVSMLKSGVHATLAGVLAAFAIPIVTADGRSPLKQLEHDLHPSVAFAILPIFAFANAGISFETMTLEMLMHPVPLGITLGLILGNQVGIMSLVAITVKLGFAKLPDRTGWRDIYGVSVLCGVGFTMSLFISSLAFGQSGGALGVDNRIGILGGSLIAALMGYGLLWFSLPAAEAGRNDSRAPERNVNTP